MTESADPLIRRGRELASSGAGAVARQQARLNPQDIADRMLEAASDPRVRTLLATYHQQALRVRPSQVVGWESGVVRINQWRYAALYALAIDTIEGNEDA